MPPADDEVAEACGLGRNLMRPEGNEQARDNQGDHCPYEVGDVEKAGDH